MSGHRDQTPLTVPAIDPVCGMAVDPVGAAGSAVHEGQTSYFCSMNCLHKFQADPRRYAEGRSAEPPPPLKSSGVVYTCPMHPEVRQDRPGTCPKCGMSLEPVGGAPPVTKVEYTCPMHPQIERDEPGSCPICGMALGPRTVTLEEGPNPKLVDMTRRFWVAAALSLPIFLIAMSEMLPGRPLHFLDMRLLNWVQLALTTPVVLWCGWPFFERGWASVVHRSPNMFTLIALGVGAAYLEDGMRIIMLTGDSRTTAEAVGRTLEIDEVIAEVLPQQKHELVQRLQAQGHVVAMAGDGINDAPALAQAQIGIAMGTGTDVAMESAAVTLVQGDLRGIARARRLSRATMRNIRQNLFLALVYNAVSVPVAAGVLYPFFGLLISPIWASAAMTLSSLSVVGNALRLRRTPL